MKNQMEEMDAEDLEEADVGTQSMAGPKRRERNERADVGTQSLEEVNVGTQTMNNPQQAKRREKMDEKATSNYVLGQDCNIKHVDHKAGDKVSLTAEEAETLRGLEIKLEPAGEE